MKPYVVLHNAVSVDGRFDGIQPDMGTFYGLVGRWKEQATLVGADTLLAAPMDEEQSGDNAEQMENSPNGGAPPDATSPDPRPLLVVTDSRGRITNWPFWRRQPYWRDVIALVSRATSRACLDSLSAQHIEYIQTGEDRVDLAAALDELNARHGIQTLRADCGGSLNGALLRARLVDEVSLLIHPALVGGSTPRSMFLAPDLATGASPISLSLTHMERLAGDLVWLIYKIEKQSTGTTQG